ncbi:MAG: diadenylate cyclase CdaA [Verrucomicrobia bacterium]|nr:diadenylate cyclase CdaA [Verrucomicrobiota bacterium]
MNFSEILKPIVEVGILATGIYYALKFIRGTRGAAVVTGFFTVLIVVAFLATVFKLQVLTWILSWFVGFFAIAVLILFQPEIRRMLAELGTNRFTVSAHQQRENIETIIQCAKNLSDDKMGALIAIEQEAKVLETCSAPGVLIDCVASPEMLQTIFFKDNALHDGGVIIKGDRIMRASCVFPLSQRQDLGNSMGTRHRAGLGLSEETDAVVIIVSEEKGFISYAYKGQLVTRVSEEDLRGFLTMIFVPKILPINKKLWFRGLLAKLGLRSNSAEEAVPQPSREKKEKRS